MKLSPTSKMYLKCCTSKPQRAIEILRKAQTEYGHPAGSAGSTARTLNSMVEKGLIHAISAPRMSARYWLADHGRQWLENNS